MNGLRAFFRHLNYSRWPVLTAAAALAAAFAALWMTESEARHAPMERASVVDVAISPDGNFVASAAQDGVLEVRSAKPGLESKWRVQRAHKAAQTLQFASYTPDADGAESERIRLIVAAADGRVSVYDAETGAQALSLDDLPTSFFTPVVAAGPGNTLWISGTSPELGAWIGHVNEAGELFSEPLAGQDDTRTLRAGQSPIVRIIPHAIDSAHTVHANGAITEWQWIARGDTSLGDGGTVLENEFRITNETIGALGHTIDAHASATNGAEMMLATEGRWETLSAAPVKTRSAGTSGILKGHEGWANSVAFSPDGAKIASGSSDRTVRVWDAETGAELAALEGDDNVWFVAYSPDGLRLVSGTADNSARVWDAETGSELLKLVGHQEWVRSVAFSPDGSKIVSGSDDRSVRVWDAATGAELLKMEGHEKEVRSVAFSPDGRRVVSGSWDNTLRLWDAATGDEFAVLENNYGVDSVAFSPDGALLASGGTGGELHVWNSETGAGLLNLEGHRERVKSVTFSPDGSKILSGSYDLTLRLWDAATGAELAVLTGHEEDVRSAAFSPDGSRIVSGGRDNTVRLWRETATGAWTSNSAPPCSLELMAASRMLNTSGVPTHFWTTDTQRLCGLALEPDIEELNENPDYLEFVQLEATVAVTRDRLVSTVQDPSNPGVGPQAEALIDELGSLLDLSDLDDEFLASGAIEPQVWLDTTLFPAIDARLAELRSDVVNDPDVLAALENAEESIFHDLRAEITAAAYLTMDKQAHENAPRALVGFGDGTVDLVSLATGETLTTYRGHGGPVTHIKVAGQRAIIGAGDGSIQVIDVPDYGAPNLARAAHVTGNVLASGRAMQLSLLDAIAPKIEREEEVAPPPTREANELADLQGLFPDNPGFVDTLEFTWRWEGASAENNWGVSQDMYNALLANRPIGTNTDVASITLQDAALVYNLLYWQRVQADEFEAPLDLVVFDTAVNMGPETALEILVAANKSTPLFAGLHELDLEAFSELPELLIETPDPSETELNIPLIQQELVEEYLNLREARYRALVSTDNTQAQFLEGWLRRVDALRVEAGIAVPARPEQQEPTAPLEQSTLPDPVATRDNILEAARTTQVSLDVPQSVRFGNSFNVTALLENRSEISGETFVASLSGDNFEITSTTPERQTMGSGDGVNWVWDVLPSTPGETSTLTLGVALELDDLSIQVRSINESVSVGSRPTDPPQQTESTDQPSDSGQFVVPLPEILGQLRDEFGGRQLNADLFNNSNNDTTYQIEWEMPNGAIRDFVVDATTGEVLEAIQRGVDPAPVRAYEPNCPDDLALDFSIYFESDSAEVTSQAGAVLDQVMTNLDGCRPASVSIVGHDDTTQTDDYSQVLSERRAASVRDGLASRGVFGGIIETEARGETDPAKATRDGVREPLNRRVDVQIR